MNNWQHFGAVEPYPSTMFQVKPVSILDLGSDELRIEREHVYLGSWWIVSLHGRQRIAMGKKFKPDFPAQIKPSELIKSEAFQFAKEAREI